MLGHLDHQQVTICDTEGSPRDRFSAVYKCPPKEGQKTGFYRYNWNYYFRGHTYSSVADNLDICNRSTPRRTPPC